MKIPGAITRSKISGSNSNPGASITGRIIADIHSAVSPSSVSVTPTSKDFIHKPEVLPDTSFEVMQGDLIEIMGQFSADYAGYNDIGDRVRIVCELNGETINNVTGLISGGDSNQETASCAYLDMLVMPSSGTATLKFLLRAATLSHRFFSAPQSGTCGAVYKVLRQL